MNGIRAYKYIGISLIDKPKFAVFLASSQKNGLPIKDWQPVVDGRRLVV